jgi:O-antigen/teichoic acid export membrane protein
MLPYALSAIAGIVLVPVFTHYLSPEQFALVALMSSITTASLTIISLKLESAVYRFHSGFESSEDKAHFLGTIFITKMILSLAISIIILGLFGYFHFQGVSLLNIPFTPFITAAILIIIFSTISTQQMAVWVAEENPKAVTIVSLANFFFMNALTIIFVIFLNEEAWGKIKAMLIVEFFTFLFMFRFTIKRIRFAFSISYLKRSLRFSFPLLLSNISSDILKNSDRFILAQFTAYKISGVSFGQIGLLHIADKFSQMINLPWKGVEKSVTPFIFNKKNEDEQKDALISVYKLWVISSGLFLLIFIGLIETFYNLFLDEKYINQTTLLATKILSVSYFFIGSYAFFSIAIGISEKTSEILKATLIATITNLLLNLLLIPIYGWIVAPISTMTASVITHFLLFRASSKLARLDFPKLFTYKCLVIVLLIYLISENINTGKMFMQFLIMLLQSLTYLLLTYYIFDLKSIINKLK